MSPGTPATVVTVPGPYAALVSMDAVLARVARDHGYPDPFVWEAGDVAGGDEFAALVLHITSQQISTAVAQRIFVRIEEQAGGCLRAAAIADEFDLPRLRSLGLSAAKARAVLGLARAQVSGDIDLYALRDGGDEAVVETLTSLRGIGRWTAEMFLIHQLRRPDVLPAGDLGIRRAVAAGWGLAATPTAGAVAAFGERWQPHRTYAAALLWSSLSAG